VIMYVAVHMSATCNRGAHWRSTIYHMVNTFSAPFGGHTQEARLGFLELEAVKLMQKNSDIKPFEAGGDEQRINPPSRELTSVF